MNTSPDEFEAYYVCLVTPRLDSLNESDLVNGSPGSMRTSKMSTERYTSQVIRERVEADIERLFAPWTVGRSENWKPDPTTKSLIALGYWLTEELSKVCKDDDDRRTLQAKYNRLSRTYDIWESAAECMNNAVDDTIPQFNSRRCKRWG